jgi:hypothetical protein
MPPIRLARIFDPEAKAIADELLDKYGYLRRNRIPVDVELLAAKLGVFVEPMEGLRSRFDMYGTLYQRLAAGKFSIVVDARHYESHPIKAPFTIAEELSHLLVHKDLFAEVRTIEDRIEFEESLDESTRRIFEAQAKKVANALLLPSSIFDPRVLEWCRTNAAEIKSDNPANENDLAEFISRKLEPVFGLSQFVIQRALTRRAPTPIIQEIRKELGIKFPPV